MENKTALTPLAIVLGSLILAGSHIYASIYGTRYMRVTDGIIMDKVTGNLSVIAPHDEKIDFKVAFHDVGKVKGVIPAK